jgi:hypothetical protein
MKGEARNPTHQARNKSQARNLKLRAYDFLITSDFTFEILKSADTTELQVWIGSARSAVLRYLRSLLS